MCDFCLGFLFTWTHAYLFAACSLPSSNIFIVYLVFQTQRNLWLFPTTPLSLSPRKTARHLSACWGRIQTVTAMTANEKKMLRKILSH